MQKQTPTLEPDITTQTTTDLLNTENLEHAARQVLDRNDHGTFTIPARGLYPHQWLWDSCFIAIGQRNYDIERAKIELLSLLRGQWRNGMLPHMILNPNQHDDASKYHKDDNVWRSWLNPNAPDDVSTSGITQPPMLAEAIIQIGKKLPADERRSWYRQVFPALLAYHEWLYSERDPHGEGLVLQVHPWETGLDNTPPWMAEMNEHLLPWWVRAMHATHLDGMVGWFRSDRAYVSLNERLTNVEALALYNVQRRLRRKNYDFYRLIDHSLFVIEDLTFNCIFIRANQHLKDIAKDIKEELPPELVKIMHRSETALEQLWDEYAQEFFSRDFVSHRLLKQSSVAAFMPLYTGVISKEKAGKIVEGLESEHRFGTPYPVPSTPLDSPWFQERRYWQGPTWLNTNWLIIEGLKRYGFNDHAEALKETTLELVAQSGFFEYFDPLNGGGAGTDNFSWTAALTIDLLHQK